MFCGIWLKFAFFNKMANISIAKMNKYPDIRSPWRQPRQTLKEVDIFPFITVTALEIFPSSIPKSIAIQVLVFPKLENIKSSKNELKTCTIESFLKVTQKEHSG